MYNKRNEKQIRIAKIFTRICCLEIKIFGTIFALLDLRLQQVLSKSVPLVGQLVGSQLQISKTALTISQLFCMKLRHYKGSKMTKPDFQKKSGSADLCIKLLKMMVFRLFSKNYYKDLLQIAYVNRQSYILSNAKKRRFRKILLLPYFAY